MFDKNSFFFFIVLQNKLSRNICIPVFLKHEISYVKKTNPNKDTAFEFYVFFFANNFLFLFLFVSKKMSSKKPKNIKKKSSKTKIHFFKFKTFNNTCIFVLKAVSTEKNDLKYCAIHS